MIVWTLDNTWNLSLKWGIPWLCIWLMFMHVHVFISFLLRRMTEGRALEIKNTLHTYCWLNRQLWVIKNNSADLKDMFSSSHFKAGSNWPCHFIVPVKKTVKGQMLSVALQTEVVIDLHAYWRVEVCGLISLYTYICKVKYLMTQCLIYFLKLYRRAVLFPVRLLGKTYILSLFFWHV